jgi:hypothetical protein
MISGVEMIGTMVDQTWRPIHVGTGFEDGINFFGEFSDSIATQALRAMHTALESSGTPCYCLRLELDSSNQGYFNRFGDIVLPANLMGPVPTVFGRLPLLRLVPDFRTWAPLAVREGPPLAILEDPSLDAITRDFLARVSWQVAIRLQNNDEYVGYLKFMGLTPSQVPDDLQILGAAYQAKLHVAGLLAHRHVQEVRTDQFFKQRLHEAAETISSLSKTEDSVLSETIDPRMALRHVADMLTSHLGAGWNRAACYWPVRHDKLRCLWAQGGSGDWGWCTGVQGPLSKTVGDIVTLEKSAKERPFPDDDAYYKAAAGNLPVEVVGISEPDNQNVLASLWYTGGDVRRLPAEHQYWEPSNLPVANMETIDRDSLGPSGAAEFHQDDPWVQHVQGSRPNDPIFVSKNGRYFAIPWFSRREPPREQIAIWVVDMAYWGRLDRQPDAPSLALTHEILAALGPAMDRHRSRLSN